MSPASSKAECGLFAKLLLRWQPNAARLVPATSTVMSSMATLPLTFHFASFTQPGRSCSWPIQVCEFRSSATTTTHDPFLPRRCDEMNRAVQQSVRMLLVGDWTRTLKCESLLLDARQVIVQLFFRQRSVLHTRCNPKPAARLSNRNIARGGFLFHSFWSVEVPATHLSDEFCTLDIGNAQRRNLLQCCGKVSRRGAICKLRFFTRHR